VAKKKAKKKGAKKASTKKKGGAKKAAKKKKARRTVMYSSKGKKLYAKRDSSGRFKDIQQYSRAHAADIRRSSKAEEAKESGAPAM
jgi:phosphoribosyl-AMP cyclohydrolase